jgi:hypothetical protein
MLVVEIDEIVPSFAFRIFVEIVEKSPWPAVMVPALINPTFKVLALARRKYASVRFWFVAHGKTDIYKSKI